nr:TPRXL isoform X1 [Ipomoea batatas]
MFSDSIANGLVPIASASPNDFSKKKRSNRLAKLKQSKLDARREQWLSQVKNKGPKEELNGGGETHVSRVEVVNERGQSIGKLELKTRVEEYNDGLVHNCSDLDSPANSPTSYTNEKQEQHDHSLDSTAQENYNVVQSISQTEFSGLLVSNVEKSGGLTPRHHVNYQAWRADDAFRPQNLPSLPKQYSFPLNSDRHISGGAVWLQKNLLVPSSCPICYEDLDLTDTSFIPCSCGFKVCLFCHKRILEEDGRCPGCRKQYDRNPIEGEAVVDGGSLKPQLARSFSMI